MNRLIKILIVLAAGLFLIGVGFTAAGLLLGATAGDSQILVDIGDKLEHTEPEEAEIPEEDDEEEESLIPEDSVDSHGRVYEMDWTTNLAIELNADELYLEAYDGDKIRIEVDDDEEDYIQVSSGEDLLKITGTKTIHDGNVRVFLPENAHLESLSIQVDAGSVEIENEIHAETLAIKIGAGSFEADEPVYSGTVSVEVGAGSVELDQIFCDFLSGNCGIGSMDLTFAGRENDYNYYLECGLGEITIGDNIHSSIADHEEISNEDTKKSMELSCGLGEILVQFLED
jgi:hypothetical protein